MEEGRALRRPLLANGCIVKDYEPLYKYWEVAEKRGVEKATIRSEDVEYVKKVVEASGRVSLLELKRTLSFMMLDRVNGEIAKEAYTMLGLELNEREAREKLADILAGWLLEACLTLNVISLRGWRLPED
ncbi:MAG: hypothetical protein DRJ51_01070 [Thermoprotei archaeon]|nr:MAG: hypothetical protein DRJ51_01070 [Thermoprotei archaeon]RLF02236.1 MAG: hypothetical protein DRJ59_04145 [Thermoprotei archaeon]